MSIRQLSACLLLAGLLPSCSSPAEEVYSSKLAHVADRQVAETRTFTVVDRQLRRNFPSICREDSWVLLSDAEGRDLRYCFDYHSMPQTADSLSEGTPANVQRNEAGDVIAIAPVAIE